MSNNTETPKNEEGITLVLGGSGKTGRRIVRRLKSQGVPTRVAARSSSPSFDWNKPEDWDAVLDGVRSVYISYSPDLAIPGATDSIQQFVDKAADYGVGRFVLLSGRGEAEARACEKIVQASDVECYMMMPVAAAVQLADSHPEIAQRAISALLFYIGIYLFMNLGAFAIVAFLRNSMHSEEIADYGGLLQRAPLAAISLTVIFTGLIGLPPGIAGFVAKFAAFQAIVSAGGTLMITLLVIAGINTVISLVYYLRVAKIMCMDPAPEGSGPVSLGFLPACFALAVTLPVVILGIVPESLAELARRAGEQLLM